MEIPHEKTDQDARIQLTTRSTHILKTSRVLYNPNQVCSTYQNESEVSMSKSVEILLKRLRKIKSNEKYFE